MGPQPSQDIFVFKLQNVIKEFTKDDDEKSPTY